METKTILIWYGILMLIVSGMFLEYGATYDTIGSYYFGGIFIVGGICLIFLNR